MYRFPTELVAGMEEKPALGFPAEDENQHFSGPYQPHPKAYHEDADRQYATPETQVGRNAVLNLLLVWLMGGD
jgi:hypothetical protein